APGDDGAQRDQDQHDRPVGPRIDSDPRDLVAPQPRQRPLPPGPLALRLVLAAFDLRRTLPHPLPAIRALGDVRAHFRPAVLADDEKVGLRHANSRIPAWPMRPAVFRAWSS